MILGHVVGLVQLSSAACWALISENYVMCFAVAFHPVCVPSLPSTKTDSNLYIFVCIDMCTNMMLCHQRTNS